MNRTIRTNPRQGGFTLLELLIAVAIVGILAAIAIPGYRDHVRRGAIEDATAGLSSGRVAVEQYYLDNRTYVGLNAGAPSFCPISTNTSFAFTCDNVTATTYTLTATGSGQLAGFTYTINQANLRTTASPWGNGNCWITRKGDAC